MHKSAKDPNDLERFFIERVNAGDIEGLVKLYESNAIIADGKRIVAVGQNQIRDFFISFLADMPQFGKSNQAKALCSGELALTSSYTSNGHITAEIAKEQPDGSWLWVVDQFTLGNIK